MLCYSLMRGASMVPASHSFEAVQEPLRAGRTRHFGAAKSGKARTSATRYWYGMVYILC